MNEGECVISDYSNSGLKECNDLGSVDVMLHNTLYQCSKSHTSCLIAHT